MVQSLGPRLDFPLTNTYLSLEPSHQWLLLLWIPRRNGLSSCMPTAPGADFSHSTCFVYMSVFLMPPGQGPFLIFSKAFNNYYNYINNAWKQFHCKKLETKHFFFTFLFLSPSYLSKYFFYVFNFKFIFHCDYKHRTLKLLSIIFKYTVQVGRYIHIFVQHISRSFHSCKTETPCPLNTISLPTLTSLYKSPWHYLSTFCLSEFHYSKYRSI